jgi:hypothetical protein
MVPDELEIYLSIKKIIEVNPNVVNEDLIKRIIALSSNDYLILDQQLDYAGSDMDILQVSNLAFLAYSIGFKQGLISKAGEESLSAAIDKLRDKSIEAVRSIALNSNYTNFRGAIGNDYFSSQIYTSLDDLSTIQEALKNGYSIVNITECLNTLKQTYNITDEEVLIVKTDFDQSLSSKPKMGTKLLNLGVYSSKTKQQLDLQLCKSMRYNIPITEGVNSTLYNYFKNMSYDIYNTNDPFYTSRCVIYYQDDYDTTLNMRRKYIFPNTTVGCNENCTFIGFDGNISAQCDCSKVSSKEMYSSQMFTEILAVYNSINIDIVSCPGSVFNVIFF